MVQNPSEEDDSSIDLDHLATQSPSIHAAAGLFTSKVTLLEYGRSSNADDDEDESSDQDAKEDGRGTDTPTLSTCMKVVHARLDGESQKQRNEEEQKETRDHVEQLACGKGTEKCEPKSDDCPWHPLRHRRPVTGHG